MPVQAAPANEAQGEPVKQPSPAVTEKPSGATQAASDAAGGLQIRCIKNPAKAGFCIRRSL